MRVLATVLAIASGLIVLLGYFFPVEFSSIAKKSSAT